MAAGGIINSVMVSSKKSKISKKVGVSIIIPVYNSEGWIGRTLSGIEKSLKKSNFDAEIIVVDDGSTDRSVAEIKQFQQKYKGSFLCIEQENKGRYVARKAGIEASTKDSILFIDSRIDVGEQSLKFLSEQLDVDTDQVWNGHVDVDKKGNIFARFWDAIVCIAWRRYFKKPRRTSFGIEDFDHYPKGTGFFFVPKSRLVAAMSHFEKNSSNLKFSSDDTLLIRYLAERQPINLSPEFSCVYHGRSTLKGFLKHAYNRGQFFVDGFLRRGTRFFYPLIAVLVASIIGAVALVVSFDPVILWLIGLLLLFAAGLFVGGKIFGVETKDAASLAFLGIPFALVYLAGIWRGVARKRPDVLMVSTLIARRALLRGSVLEYLLVSLLYACVAIAVMGFIPFTGISSVIFAGGPGDATSGFVWLNYIDSSLDFSVNHTDMVSYPAGEDPSSPIFITYLLLWGPIRLLSYFFGPIVSINIMTVFGFVFTATAAYWYIKKITGSILVALFAGYSLAFFPYAIAKGTAHLAYIFNGMFILLMAAFFALWARPSWQRALILAAAYAACFYFDGYFILLSTVMLLTLFIGVMLHDLILLKVSSVVLNIGQKIKSLALAAVMFAVLVSPIAAVALLNSSGVGDTLHMSRSDISVEIPFYKSWTIDFLIPSKDNPLFEGIDWYDKLQDYRQGRSDKLSNTSFLGYTNIILAAIGVVLAVVYLLGRYRVRRGLAPRWPFITSVIGARSKVFLPLTSAFLVSFVVFVGFMFSPSIDIFGYKIPMPGALFIEFDISLWRNLSRFSGPLQVVLVIYASYTLWLLLRVILSKFSKGSVVSVALAIVCIASLVPTYLNSVNSPSYDLRQQPQVYRYLNSHSDIHVIAQLPIVDPLDEYSSSYFTTQMIHGKKMVNTKDPRYRVLANNLGSLENRESIDWAYHQGATHLVVRQDACVSRAEGISLEFDDSKDGWCLYRFAGSEQVDDSFVRFDRGVDATPNYDRENVNTLRLNSATVKMSITRSDLKTPSRGKGVFESDLVNWNRQNPIGGTWRLVQDGRDIASGEVLGDVTKLYAIIDRSKELYLVLQRENDGNDLLLQNTVVDGVEL